MFKSKEELKKSEYVSMLQVIIHESAINDTFQSFSKRVEFYKKYHVKDTFSTGDYKYKLKRYHPKVFKLFLQNQKNMYHVEAESWYLSRMSSGSAKGDFNNWLFDYCFGDV